MQLGPLELSASKNATSARGGVRPREQDGVQTNVVALIRNLTFPLLWDVSIGGFNPDL